MIPARNPQRFGGNTKLLALTSQSNGHNNSNTQIQHTTVSNLIEYFNPGDLLIVNRSATLPASFRGNLQRTGEFVEIRLAAFLGPNPSHLQNWQAFSFGKGDWTIPTEERESPPFLKTGDKIILGSDLSLEVISCKYNRLLEVRFMSSALEKNLYRYGRPIQYSYLDENLEVWDQQTIFSGPPISVEPPSASFPLTWELIISLRKKGVHIADLLHGAGISSTGLAELDQMLPLTEWYDIPIKTTEAFHQAKQNNQNIIAVGTTVLRSMESAWVNNHLRSGEGNTNLKITPGYKIQTVNALITGMHEVGSSHMNILDSICPIEQIRKGYAEAEQREYRGHEFGDVAFLRCGEIF